jgi:hypothetical protein
LHLLCWWILRFLMLGIQDQLTSVILRCVMLGSPLNSVFSNVSCLEFTIAFTSALLSDAWNAQHSPLMSAWYTIIRWNLINSSASLFGIQCNICDWHKNLKLLNIVLLVCVAAWWLECDPRCQGTPISGGMKPIMCDGIWLLTFTTCNYI